MSRAYLPNAIYKIYLLIYAIAALTIRSNIKSGSIGIKSFEGRRIESGRGAVGRATYRRETQL
ncbi:MULTISPECIES: hypothetical protein [unclassified Okeania]|uniref:hypothetical protein n=1 Tax=unclassified Okeania TaxID=2634635 RepID=UPI0013BC5DB1|nr:MULTISPECIES: hypothetical protein [unclassified Okeania]NET18703.1 hypothetical protein [Okeania sp. SIO1H5]NET93257.1 hypothetical protein [Okeania sp. SIO1H2]